MSQSKLKAENAWLVSFLFPIIQNRYKFHIHCTSKQDPQKVFYVLEKTLYYVKCQVLSVFSLTLLNPLSL